MPHRQTVAFGKKFLWGVSSSAHQVEGGQHNQWTVWELENAKALAAQSSYHYDDLEGWPKHRAQAALASNYVSGRAVDHHTMYAHDIELIRKMNMNTYRFSIEWSRIQPELDTWNAAEVEHYREVIRACQARGGGR